MAKAAKLGKVLGRVKGVDLVRDMVALTEIWPKVVDPWLVQRSWPLALKDGRLTIGTDDPAIAHHLTLAAKSSLESGEDGLEELISAQVVTRLNELLGRALVKDIRFKTAPRPSRGGWDRERTYLEKSQPPPLPPLSQAQRDRLTARAGRVTDPDLRAALLKLVKGL